MKKPGENPGLLRITATSANHFGGPISLSLVDRAQDVVGFDANVRTGHIGIHRAEGVHRGAGRAGGFRFDELVSSEEVGSNRCICTGLLVFQGPAGLRSLQLAHVVQTGVRLAGLTGFHKVGDRDSGQHADDRNHNHDFHQGETRLPCQCRFHNSFLVTSCSLR